MATGTAITTTLNATASARRNHFDQPECEADSSTSDRSKGTCEKAAPRGSKLGMKPPSTRPSPRRLGAVSALWSNQRCGSRADGPAYADRGETTRHVWICVIESARATQHPSLSIIQDPTVVPPSRAMSAFKTGPSAQSKIPNRFPLFPLRQSCQPVPFRHTSLYKTENRLGL